MKKKLTLCALTALSLSLNALAQPQSNEKMQLALKLVQITEAASLGKKVVDQITKLVVEGQKKRDPKKTAQLKKILQSEIRPNELETLYARIFAENFTQNDIEGLIQFYETPLGKKMIRKQDSIYAEGSKRAKVWAKSYMQRVLARVRAEFIPNSKKSRRPANQQ